MVQEFQGGEMAVRWREADRPALAQLLHREKWFLYCYILHKRLSKKTIYFYVCLRK